MINKLRTKINEYAKIFIKTLLKINYIFLNNNGIGNSHNNKFFISVLFINLLDMELSVYLELGYLNQESSKILQELNIFIDSLTWEFFLDSYYRRKFDFYKLNFENLNRVGVHIYREKNFLEMNDISNKLSREHSFYWSNIKPCILERFGDIWERDRLNNLNNVSKVIKTNVKFNTPEENYFILKSNKTLFIITTISITLITVIIK